MSKLKVNEIEPFSSTGIAVGGPPTANPSALWDFQTITQGILPPRLTTVQRNAIASPVKGLLIYNTDSLILETYDGTQWDNAANALTRPRHFIRVLKNAPLDAGDFSSIYAAVNSIVLPDPADPWIVWVGPGVYIEPQIDVPPGVHIVGANQDSCYVQPDSPNHHIFTLTAGAAPNTVGSTLSFLSLQNAGVGTAAIKCNDSGDFVLIHKVTINNCDIGLWFKSDTRDCFNFIEYVDTTGGNIGIKIEANNNFICYVNAENFYVFTADPTNVNPADGALVTGVGAQFICHASGFEGGDNSSGNAIRVNDGVLLDMKAVSFRSWNKGLEVENIGSACDINITAANYLHNTQDINVAQPSAKGAIQATAEEESSFFDVGNINNLSLLLLDPDDGQLVTSGSLKRRQPDNVFTDTTTIATNASALGILLNGDINPPGSPTSFVVVVEAGMGYLEKSDGSLRKVIWPDTTVTLPPSTTSYIYFDENAVVHLSGALPNTTENIVLGRAVTHSTGIELLEESGFQAIHMSNALSKSLRDSIGVMYSSGSIVSEVGTRNLSVTSGSYYLGELNYLANGANPATWVSFYQDGLGGFTRVPTQTVVDNAFWDNGTGTLAALGSGNYAKHAIYALGDSTGDFDSEAYFLVYSQAQYTALTLAEQGSLPNPPSFLSGGVALIASVIVQEGAAHIIEVRDERNILGSGRVSNVAASTFHHNLLGLNDFDDHLRYLPVNGSRPMTGDLPMGTHNVTNAGTYNGVVVENHHARHQPGSGLDELPTAAASTLTPDLSNATGTSTSLSRADHIHNIPTDVVVDIGTANAQGVAAKFSRSDHVHKGLRSLQSNGGTQRFGDINLKSGPGFSIVDNGDNSFTFDTVSAENELSVTNGGGLTANYTTGIVWFNGSLTVIPAGSLSLTASQTNWFVYVDVDAVVKNAASVPPNAIPLAKFSTGVSTITSLSDAREKIDHSLVWGLSGDISTILPDAVAAAGSTNKYADAGHTHAIATAAASTQTPNQANAKGTSTSFARADHIHNIPTGAPSSLTPNAGNIQGTAAAFAQQDHIHNVPTAAPASQTPDQANADGIASTFSKSDHIHNIPTATASGLNANSTNTQGTAASFARSDHTHAIASGTPSTQTPNNSNAAGTSANFARADHVHNIPTGTPSSLTPNAGNSQGSAAAFAQQDHIHNVPTAAPANQTIAAVASDGVAATFSRSDHLHTFSTAAPSTQNADQSNAVGTSTSFARADHIHNIPTATPTDIGSANAQGSAITFAKSDHVHKGVHSFKANAGTQRFGDLSLVSGVGATVTDDGSGNFTIETVLGGNELFVTQGAGLTANYTAGRVKINGTTFSVSAGSITVVTGATNGRIYVDTDGTVKSTTSTSTPPNAVPLAIFSSSGAAITALSDNRTVLNVNIMFGAGSDIVTILPDAVAAAGATNKYADAGHTHAIATAAASTQTPNQANAKGTSTSFARADHVHNIPTGAPSTQTPNQTNTQGTAAAFAQQDHIHNIPTGTPSTLNATNSNTQGTAAAFAQQDHLHAISTGAPSTQTPDQSNATGTSANLARADHIHNIPTGVASTISSNANAQGTAAAFARQDHTHELTVAAASLDHIPQYDGSNWQAVYPEANLSLARATVLREDWISSVVAGALGWTSAVVGGGSTITIVSGAAPLDSGHPGVVNITAGNAAARFADLHLGPSSMVPGGGAITIECVFQLATLTNAAFRIGLGDQTAADFNDGVYLEYNSGVSANWLIKTAAGGTRTSTTTTVAATANAWHKLVITINAAGTSASYTLDGTSLGTITTNIPTTAANACAPNLQADSLAATSSTFYVDYFNMYQRFTTSR